MAEGELAELADRVRLAGGDHVVARARPAAASATWPRRSRRRSPSRAAASRLPSRSSSSRPSLMRATPWVTLRVDELEAARGDSVVEQDAARRVQVVALAVVDRDPVAVDLGHAVRDCGGRTACSPSGAPRPPCRTSRSSWPGRSGCPGRRCGSRRAGGSRRARSISPVSTGWPNDVCTKDWAARL